MLNVSNRRDASVNLEAAFNRNLKLIRGASQWSGNALGRRKGAKQSRFLVHVSKQPFCDARIIMVKYRYVTSELGVTSIKKCSTIQVFSIKIM